MWVSDGSAEITVESDRVVCKANGGGNVYNALWKDREEGLQTGKAYWKISLDESKDGLFAGVTDTKHFQKGWACKGLLYGGNLSNGGCLLVQNFGPWPKAGDIVGILVDASDSGIKVYFDINGRPLGMGFDVPRNTLGGIFPAIHFSGSGIVSIKKSDEFPSTSRQEESFDGLEGHWEYTSGSFDLSGKLKVTLDVKAFKENMYKGSLHVLNTIGVAISRESPTSPWKGHPGATTLMGGPEDLMRLESQFSSHVSGTFGIDASGNLVISEGEKSSLWKRYVPQMTPVTDNPFQ